MKITASKLRKIIKEACGDVLQSHEEIDDEVKYGHGGKARMAKQQLFQIVQGAADLHDLLDDDDELPEWVQSKIAVIEDNIDSIHGHLSYKHRNHLGGDEIDVADLDESDSDEVFDFVGAFI